MLRSSLLSSVELSLAVCQADVSLFMLGILVEDTSKAMFSYANADLALSYVESCTVVDGIATCDNINPGQTTFGEGTATLTPTDTFGSVAPAQTTAQPGASLPTASATPLQPSSPFPSANSGVRSPPSMAGLAGMLGIFWNVLS
ncbi:hypothetical protein PAXRUDRAFT_31758 [Paxillus rubicundulus Ve08.2h10]|uniref:Uncharacterized protein n=1 Tax=Paxillus rubicundulus Ve08.2h10 TaxID=930991 RepID=A0A0D0E793_9AGAM|nr:hypothetical protein PAXRUDRAFT_31758 [Paxillus rubicundulus Ve08.2h10]